MSEATASAKGNPLWDFATWAYAQPSVEKACLALQNRLGADVNMILFCLWLAYRGSGSRNLAKHLGSAIKLSRDWQKGMVEPLRTCRTNFKEHIETAGMTPADQEKATALRERIKQCELEMEQLQTLALYALVDDGEDKGMTRSPKDQKDDAQNNLTVYFAATGIKPDPLGQTHMLRIISSVFGS